MILRVVDQAKKVEGFDDLCVATDDERIAEICRALMRATSLKRSVPEG
jgi:3-deoxy-manno-octulosonate cytidylyltransferase (CMP-KDO synthetase)